MLTLRIPHPPTDLSPLFPSPSISPTHPIPSIYSLHTPQQPREPARQLLTTDTRRKTKLTSRTAPALLGGAGSARTGVQDGVASCPPLGRGFTTLVFLISRAQAEGRRFLHAAEAAGAAGRGGGVGGTVGCRALVAVVGDCGRFADFADAESGRCGAV